MKQHYSPTGRYSPNCRFCLVGVIHEMKQHKNSIKEMKAITKRLAAQKKHKARSIFGWTVQIHSIK